MNKNNINRNSAFALMGVLLASAGIWSCQTDLSYPEAAGPNEVVFSGKVGDMAALKTRFDTAYINSTLYDTNFYIEQTVDFPTGSETQFGIYKVPSGYEGRLTSIDEDQALQWQDLSSLHTFYSWTLPWDLDFTPDTDDVSSIPVTFYSSSDESGYAEYKNNEILEKFIGAKSGPYSYENNGKYVDFTFNHLVSKIKIGTFQLIEANGSIQKNLKADITFIGMPSDATFYPHPEDGSAPYVEPGEAEENTGVIFYIANDVASDYFYICPEIDFRQINYQVKLRNEEYVNAAIDIYYGTFDNVVFQRTAGTDYDQGEGEDDTILHAGEMMTLNITLIPGIGPGLAVTIDKWSTEDFDKDSKDDETLYHAEPGMYSDSEVKGLVDLFSGMDNNNFCERLNEMERLMELYGEEVDMDGIMQKVLYLYENVTINSNIFPIYKEYLLNGMGHVITMNTNYGNGNGFFGGNTTYFNIGPVRDVYLSNPQGTVRLYIDPDGWVYTYNANTNAYTKSEYQLTELDGNTKGYDIDSVTGKVRKTFYFNNPLGENDKPFPSCEEDD